MRVRDDLRFLSNAHSHLGLNHLLPPRWKADKQHQQQSLPGNFHDCAKHDKRLWSHSKIGVTPLVFAFLLWMMVQVADSMGPPYPEPEFLPRLLNVTAREGGSAKLPCAVHYLGTREVAWRKVSESHFLFVGKFNFVKDSKFHLDFVELTPEVTEWNLIISKVTPSDAGQYECRITSTTQMNRVITLNVVGPPIVEKAYSPVIVITGKRYVDQGQPMKLVCNASGPDYRKLRVEWFKDGNVLDRAVYPHIYFVSYEVEATRILVSELRIDRTRKNDTGLYICRSSAGYIDNLKVTILSANTPKEKRDNQVEDTTESAGVTLQSTKCLLFYLIVTVIMTTCIISPSITDHFTQMITTFNNLLGFCTTWSKEMFSFFSTHHFITEFAPPNPQSKDADSIRPLSFDASFVTDSQKFTHRKFYMRSYSDNLR